MAKNLKYTAADSLSVACTDPASPVSGSPVRYGQRPGLALTDERTDGTTTVKFSGVATLSVKGVDGSGNVAVAEGDKLFYVDGDTPKISKKATGVFYGYAKGAVTSGGTASIDVIIGF